MKFAICNETYQGWTFEKTCEDIEAAGYHGVEIAPYTLDEDPLRLTEAQAEAAGKVVRDAGLEVVGLHWLLVRPGGDELHLTTPVDHVRQRTVDYAKHLVSLCAAMGGKVMVWGSPKQRTVAEDQSYDEAFENARAALSEVCKAAEPHGIEIALEPLGTKETNFLTTAEETIKLIEAVDSPSCQLHLDVKAMSSEEKPMPRIIADSAKYLRHFHANDPNLQGPGTGEVDHVPIAKALKDIDYDGYVSVEVFKYDAGGPMIARGAMEYLQEVYG